MGDSAYGLLPEAFAVQFCTTIRGWDVETVLAIAFRRVS